MPLLCFRAASSGVFTWQTASRDSLQRVGFTFSDVAFLLSGLLLFLKLADVLPHQIDAKKEQLADARRDLKSAKADAKVMKDAKTKKYVPGSVESWGSVE